MKLARIAIDRPVMVYMFFLAVLLLGFVSLRELSVDLLPDISYPRLSVETDYQGVAPEEIEQLITKPLEAAVSRIPGLRRVESISKEGISYMTLEFDWGTNMDFTMLHAREQLDNARDRIPEDAGNPTIIALDPQSKPIMVLAISGERSLLELKELSEELIKPRLEQIEGIGSAEITGGVEREIQVEVDPKLLALYSLTVNDIAGRISAFNQSLTGGTIRKGKFKYSIRIVGQFETVDEIGEISLKTTKERGVIRLKDVARIEDAIKERQGMTRLNASESIGIQVRKESGANTVKVSKLARDVIVQIQKENSQIKIHVVSEQSKYIETAVKSVKDELIQGAILAFLCLLIFLQEWKTPLIIDTVIPISVIGTFSLLYFNNITLNIMSLGGLALGVGMLDDCAVVVSENIFRHRSLGKNPADAAYDATSEIGGAVISTALTTIVVFLPIIYVHGVAGQLFKDTALTVTFALLSSLFVSLTLLPTLQSREFRTPGASTGAGSRTRMPRWVAPKSKFLAILLAPFLAIRWLIAAGLTLVFMILNFFFSLISQLIAHTVRIVLWPFKPLFAAIFRAFSAVYGRFTAWYGRALVWSLDHKKTIFFWSFVFFGATFAAAGLIKRELMPKMKTTSFEVFLKMPVDYSLDQTADMAGMLERHLGAQKPVRTTLAQIGIVSGAEAGNPDVALNTASVFVEVEKPSQVEPVLEAMRRRLADFPDIGYSISREQSLLSQFLAFSASDIGLRVKGEDLARIQEITNDLVLKIKTIPGIADVNTNIGEGKPEFKIKIKKDALAKYANITPDLIGRFIVTAVRGQVATQFNELEKKYDILVRMEAGSRENIESLLDEMLPVQGMLVPLRDLVDYEIVRGPREIRRENQQREILVTANLRGAKISDVTPAINAKIAELNLPLDYKVVFGGEREEMTKSFNSLIIALAIAIILTYMVMAAQFESLLHPFLIMFTLPMGAAGTIFALLLTGQTVNVISIIGMVVLVGLVVDDATVEIDYTNLLRKQGKKLREAVVEGCRTRLRPIMIASMTTIVGLFPMALGLETGGELMRPLGIVVLSGLTFSTFLTLILIPVMYEWTEKKREKKSGT
jgi:hydrophobic/amphiphilic exporter-1 (mainly G- bacteria), HAE1 family